MAVEVYSNNASTTVAIGGYTPASGVLNVASTGSPFLSVATGVTQMHLLVYRIIGGLITPIVNFVATNTVSATQWAVTAEGSDNAALAGDIVICVLSSAGMNQIRGDVSQGGTFSGLPATTNQKTGNLYFQSDGPYIHRFDGSNWIAYSGGRGQVTVPPSAGWTWDNQGSSTLATTNGAFLFNFIPHQSAVKGRVYYRTAPAAPYTITALFKVDLSGVFANDFITGGSPGGGIGLTFRDGTGKLVSFMWLNNTPNPALQTDKWTNTTTYSASYLTTGSNIVAINLFGGDIWMRITDNGSNLLFSISLDGQAWFQFDTRGRTDFLSSGPTQVGVFCYDVAVGITAQLISWTVT